MGNQSLRDVLEKHGSNALPVEWKYYPLRKLIADPAKMLAKMRLVVAQVNQTLLRWLRFSSWVLEGGNLRNHRRRQQVLQTLVPIESVVKILDSTGG